MGAPQLLDIVYLILQQLDNYGDLKNACLVSRAWNEVATPLLYRSVVLSYPRTSWDDLDKPKVESPSKCLVRYLLDERKVNLRSWVRKVTINCSSSWLQDPDEPPEDALATLIQQLPNLDDVYLRITIDLSENFLDAVRSHARKPNLHLLDGYHKGQVLSPMPFVRSLKKYVNLKRGYRGSGKCLALDEWFGAFPNLRNLSVKIDRMPFGCIMGHSTRSTVAEYEPSPGQPVPALESLALSGYHIEEGELPNWREKISWSTLKSLKLGPQTNKRIFEVMPGDSLFLKTFKISTLNKNRIDNSELNTFLLSFDTLESITAKGYTPSLQAIGNHYYLKHLCLHQIEIPNHRRQFLKVAHLDKLDRVCPKLQSLELDISQIKGKWPRKFVTAFASRFVNLRSLCFHIALGLRDADENDYEDDYEDDSEDDNEDSEGNIEEDTKEDIKYETKADTKDDSKDNAKDDAEKDAEKDAEEERMRAVLTEFTAKTFIEMFCRDRESSSKLRKLTLKTGEKLRHFPQWPPRFSTWESSFAKISEVFFPLSPGFIPVVKEVE